MKKFKVNNVGLKFLAVLFSCLLWLIVVNYNDPIITISYSDISVQLLNAEVLEEQEVIYNVLDSTDLVTVYVTATRSVLEDITRDNIYVFADLEDISYLDTVRIQAYTNKNDNEINNITTNIENVKLSLENAVSKQLVITTNITGNPSSGHIVGDISMNQNIVRISGPESVVSEVEKVVVDIDISGMDTMVNTSAELKFYNTNNQRIEADSLTANISEVSLGINILESKNVPISVNITGNIEEGYVLSGEFQVNPSTIQVAGAKNDIAKITSIVIPEGEVSVTGATENVTQAVNISKYLPSNVQFADESFNGYVNVTITVDKLISKSLSVNTSQITFINDIEGYKAVTESDDIIFISVTGSKSIIDDLDVDRLVGVVDLSPLSSNEISEDDSYPVTISWNEISGLEIEQIGDVYISFISN